MKILVVDDEPDVTDLLEYKLTREGYVVKAINQSIKIMGVAREFKPDLLLLDVMMPEMNGLQICSMLKSDPIMEDVPIIFLTAKGEPRDRVKGLEKGADDYIIKPFDIQEVIIRIKTLFKRINLNSDGSSKYLQAGEVILDLENYCAIIKDKTIELTATEFKLLKLLMERKGRVQTRENLLVNVWSYESDIETRTIDTHIRRLREKLEDNPIIETIRGIGYRIKEPIK